MSWLLEDFPNFVIFGCFELRVDTDAAVPVGVVGVVVDDARAEAKEIRGVDAFALFLVVGFSVAVACDPCLPFPFFPFLLETKKLLKIL